MMKTVAVALALTGLALASAGSARADDWDKKTLIVDVDDSAALKTAPIAATTPEAKEVPVAAAIQTTPNDKLASVATVPTSSSSPVGRTGVKQTRRSAGRARHLPKTASAWPLIVVFG